MENEKGPENRSLLGQLFIVLLVGIAVLEMVTPVKVIIELVGVNWISTRGLIGMATGGHRLTRPAGRLSAPGSDGLPWLFYPLP